MFGLAAVFAGMTMLLVAVAAAFRSPVVAVLAVTLGVATYFFWYQASGRLRASVREQARRARATRDARDPRDPREARGAGRARGRFEGAPGGFGAGAADAGRRQRTRRTGGGPGAGAAGRQRARPRTDPDEPTRAEAYATLGVDPDADEGEIKRAYREKVKEVHPDRGGDEEAFRSVTRAYDRLT